MAVSLYLPFKMFPYALSFFFPNWYLSSPVPLILLYLSLAASKLDHRQSVFWEADSPEERPLRPIPAD
uniref:Uncharacterized protein n=1 Tax=Aegilops tauschii subsp. strangulata TaxID=200361 RepID=A0A453M7L5_AEGTS